MEVRCEVNSVTGDAGEGGMEGGGGVVASVMGNAGEEGGGRGVGVGTGGGGGGDNVLAVSSSNVEATLRMGWWVGCVVTRVLLWRVVVVASESKKTST